MVKTIIWIALVSGIGLYALLLACLFFYQEKLIFPAEKLKPDHVFDFHVPFREHAIAVDGATINVLHFFQKEPKGLVFFLHGNAGNLQTWATDLEFYQRINYDLVMMDYRGYGKSTGKISNELQLHQDVRAVWDHFSPQYENHLKVIVGRSLGSALATRLAVDVDPDLLILVSAFTSMKAMAASEYPFAPLFLLKYPLQTDAIINQVKAELLFINGAEDKLTPTQHSQTLFELSDTQKHLVEIEGADHGAIHNFPQYYHTLAEQIHRIK